MAFNTNSFLAGIGAVVAVLSTGVAGGYLLTNPSHIDPPNRLQRVAATNQDSKPAPVAAVARPEVVAAVAPTAAPAMEPAAQPVTQAITAPAAQPVVTPPEAKTSEPARTAAIQETAAPAPTAKLDTDAKTNVERANADKARAPDARAVDKKRTETRKIAEQQRRQRELEVATIAVRRIIHERDAPDIVVDSDRTEAPAAEMPHFTLFGQ
jgi:hypothetical protein